MPGVHRSEAERAGVFVTPDIQHVALARSDAEFAAATAGAQIVVADGFPVYRFATARGLALPGRVAGHGAVERMFADPAALAGYRACFVVDTDRTARLIEERPVAAAMLHDVRDTRS